MHLRNLFAGEPGGFQGMLCPICQKPVNQGTLSFPAHSLKTELTGKRALVSSNKPKYQVEGNVYHLQIMPWDTISMSEI